MLPSAGREAFLPMPTARSILKFRFQHSGKGKGQQGIAEFFGEEAEDGQEQF